MTDKKAEVKKEESKRNYKHYYLDLNGPVQNNLITLESAAKYLSQNIKVKGLKNHLEDLIKIHPIKNDKVKNTVLIYVDSNTKFSKRYIRYLTKKFLKKEGIARYLVVASTAPNTYTVRYIKKNEA